LDRVERADLDANLAAHTDREVDVENSGINLRFADVIRLLVLALLDVDAFWRTILLTNLARDTAESGHRIVAVEHEEWKLPDRFLERLPFFRILDGGQPFLGHVTSEKIFGGDRHAFDDAFA